MKKGLYKYYKGEEKNPYDKEKDYAKSWFWHGEMMHATNEGWPEHWTQEAKMVRPKLKGKFVELAKYDDEHLGVILVIDALFGKWNPYGYDPEMILEY